MLGLPGCPHCLRNACGSPHCIGYLTLFKDHRMQRRNCQPPLTSVCYLPMHIGMFAIRDSQDLWVLVGCWDTRQPASLPFARRRPGPQTNGSGFSGLLHCSPSPPHELAIGGAQNSLSIASPQYLPSLSSRPGLLVRPCQASGADRESRSKERTKEKRRYSKSFLRPTCAREGCIEEVNQTADPRQTQAEAT